MSLATSSRPQYGQCSLRPCGKDLLHKDYIAVLVEAGVDQDRLLNDLLIDRDSCCTREIISSLPSSDVEYVERLDKIKSVRLSSPPPFNLSYIGEELRPKFHKNKVGSKITNEFLGAEPYYYLVERGENPTTALYHLGIDEVDFDRILAVTDRPETEGECPHCGEHIPHAKFLSVLYRREGAEEFIPPSDRVSDTCCKDYVMSIDLTKEERDEAEELLRHAESRFSGIPVDFESPEVCMSCGSEDTRHYHDYEWLVHHGIPPVVALNYFGINRLCCRGATMNPIIVPRESMAVNVRRLKQEAAIPPEPIVEYDYESNRLPKLSGRV